MEHGIFTSKSHDNRSNVRQIIQMEATRFVLNTYGGIATNLLANGQVFCIVSLAKKIQYFTWVIFKRQYKCFIRGLTYRGHTSA